MNEEWYQPQEWNQSTSEYDLLATDIVPTGCEIVEPQPVQADSTEFYVSDGTKAEQTGSDFFSPNKKRLRKILYGLTSMAMVVSLGRSLAGGRPAGVLSDQPVGFSIYNRHADYAQNGILAVGGADSIAGVGHVQYGFRRVDYNGNPLAAENKKSYGYNGKWINADGYALTYGHHVYAVYAPDGRLLCEWARSDFPGVVRQAAISNDNVVFFQLETDTSTRTIQQNVYYNIYGQELCRIDCSRTVNSNGYSIHGAPIRDSMTVCNDETGILLIKATGESVRLVNWPVTQDTETRMEKVFQVERDGTLSGSDGSYQLQNVPCIVSDGLSEGYFLAVDTAGSLALIHAESGTMYRVDGAYGSTDVEDITSGHYVAYSDNEGKMLHLGTLMCKVEKNSDKQIKYYLFDVTKHCNTLGERTGSLACYDAIWFEDDPYLLVRDNEEYCYIDLSGNRVSESYSKASTFNDCGYALVQTQSGAVYVIDREFNKLEQLRGVDDFSIKDIGEVFWVTCDGQPYSYYYGPQMQ